jgi:ADP-ribose pyrophosphatase
MDLKWTTLSSKQIIKDKWFSLRADSCQTPDGGIVDPYYVLEYPDWVSVVPVTSDNEIILVKQYRHATGQSVLEIPGGGVDPKDSGPLEAVQRELFEETGYSSRAFVELCKLNPNPASHANTMHGFLALDAVLTAAQTLDANEQIEVIKLPIHEVKTMLLKNQFSQALHTAVLFYAMEYLSHRRK